MSHLRDSAYFHIVGRNNNSTSGYFWEPGDGSITAAWTTSTSNAYRGDGSSVDRTRGICYYGSASHSGKSAAALRVTDGSIMASTTQTAFDKHTCVFVHPNGHAFYKYRSTTASVSTNFHVARATDFSTLNTISKTPYIQHSTIGKVASNSTAYIIDMCIDLYDRPDRNIILLMTNTSSNWNSDSTSINHLWVYQYDIIDNTQNLLITFDPDNYTSDSVRTRVSEIMCKDNGNFIIQMRAGSTDGGLFMEIPRYGAGAGTISNPTAVWSVNKRTVNGDVRRQLGRVDLISQKYLYLGSGSTNDPEPVGLISLTNGSVLGFRESVATDGSNEHRTHCGQPCLWGKWSEGPDADGTPYNNLRPYSQLIYFSGFTGNHNPNPNLAFFNGSPTSEWNNTDTEIVKLDTTSRNCGAVTDANGMQGAMATTGGFVKDDQMILMHSYGENSIMLSGRANRMYDENNNQMIHMRHGKRWLGGTVLFAGH